MEQLDIFYRALKGLKVQTENNGEIQALIDAILSASQENDRFDAERTYCIIEEDWVEKIEKEIVFVAKAIEEDRQFIIQNGEVVPIEKIKKVSTATVRHLARHSNLITREPEEGKNILPEKLYMVENLSDYAVYENRFLYMLLRYLQDFIALRLQEIVEVGKTYRSTLVIEKDVHYRKRHLTYSARLFDEDKDDPLAHLFPNSTPIIKRIEDIYQIVLALLATPLMKEVSQVPMIKPPITKTNVLKMNNNFVHAVELYYYVSAYNDKGYRVEKITKTYSPLSDRFLGECASIIALSAYLSYKYGCDLEKRLEENFRENEEKLKEVEAKKLREKISGLKARLELEGVGLEEYCIALEENNKTIDYLNGKLDEARAELEKAVAENQRLKAEIDVTKKDVAYYQREAEDKLQKYVARELELGDKIRDLDESKRKQDEEYNEKMAHIQNEIDQGVERLRDSLQQDAQKALNMYKSQLLSQLESEKSRVLRECENSYENKKRECAYEASVLKGQLEEEKKKYAELKESYDFNTAQLIGLRAQHNLPALIEDYTDEARFLELEGQFEAFAKFFKAEWNKTKKRIRKEILWKLKAEQGAERNGEAKTEKEEFSKPVESDNNN